MFTVSMTKDGHFCSYMFGCAPARHKKAGERLFFSFPGYIQESYAVRQAFLQAVYVSGKEEHCVSQGLFTAAAYRLEAKLLVIKARAQIVPKEPDLNDVRVKVCHILQDGIHQCLNIRKGNIRRILQAQDFSRV